MEGRALLQYLIDTSDITLQKKQEATEYLAKLAEAAQQSAEPCPIHGRDYNGMCSMCVDAVTRRP